ncbi:MAG TPA: oligopeptide ABC transporter permease OppB [Steroidobacteraceae bacterium]|jgi:oligopeptide transport system permease protein|nr:oligopeptide ABC transporter permease OppB [Steroidobacteraceae bacterium]HXP25773.1 oligopeptide ABC transporter permease OppB [Steroidobacteraceae bacterium]
MTRYFFTRLAGAVPTLFIIITITFFLMRAAPGGPFDQEQALAPEIKANLQRAYGLDQPVWTQYGRYLKSLLHGDFGPSFKYKDFTVTELIGQGFPVTLQLGVMAIALALLLGVPLGTFAALHHNSAADTATMSLVVTGIAIPSFVVLPFLGLLFGVYLHWLPVAGWESGSLRHLALPVIALALPPLAYIARLTRGSMLEILRSHYIRTAFAKGLPVHSVIIRHALKPALAPVASYLVPAVASILTGSLVVESIAGLPGIGRYLVQGAINRDYTLVLGMVIIYSALLIVMGLLVDLLYAWLDPRVRL